MSWNTLHIFGYGETQLITDTINKKVATSGLTAAPAVVSGIYAHKPVDSTASSQYHAINIINNCFADWIPETGESFRVQWSDLTAQDLLDIDALVLEVENA